MLLKTKGMDVTRIVIGCNYHTTWQTHPAMRFVLVDVVDETAILATTRTKKLINTSLDSLVFIDSTDNKNKARMLESSCGDVFKQQIFSQIRLARLYYLQKEN